MVKGTDFNHTFKVRGIITWEKAAVDANCPPGMGIKFLNVPEAGQRVLLLYLANSRIKRQEQELAQP